MSTTGTDERRPIVVTAAPIQPAAGGATGTDDRAPIAVTVVAPRADGR